MYKIPDNIIDIGRKLRLNMTVSERKIWHELKNKNLGIKVLRIKNEDILDNLDNVLNRIKAYL